MKNSIKTDCLSCKNNACQFFSVLSEDSLQRMGKPVLQNNYNRGQTIFYEGSRPYGLYCVKEGKVKLSKSSADGKKLIVKIAGKGELLCYWDFFTNENYSLTAEIFENSTLCFLERELFFELIKQNSQLNFNFLKLMAEEINEAEEKSTNLAYKSTRERIIDLLLNLNENYGMKMEDGSYKIGVNMSRQEMADMIGSSTETTVRLLTWLKGKNLIDSRKKFIYINNLQKLKHLLPENYQYQD